MTKVKLLDRSITTVFLVMVFGIVVILGPMALIAFLLLVETKVVQELFNLFVCKPVGKSQKKFAWISWYFYIIAALYIVPDAILSHFSEIGVGNFVSNKIWHSYIFALYCAYCYGFIRSVHAMNIGSCHLELQRFCWAHMVILWTIIQTYFVIRNILTGMFYPLHWLFATIYLPTYVESCLESPTLQTISKKDVGRIHRRSHYHACRVCSSLAFDGTTLVYALPSNGEDLSLRATIWHKSTCIPSAVLIPKEIDLLPEMLNYFMNHMLGFNASFTVAYNHFQIHALVLGFFASSIAPFGGLLASAIKRASQVKDFGNILGEHGGVSDRTDCHLLMGVFTRLYYMAIISNCM